MIMTSLAGEARHGYGIMRDVERLSDGRVTILAGTLYAALDRLRSEDLVDVEREEIVDTRVRRYYRLTDAGKTALSSEASKLKSLSTAALRRLSPSLGAS